MVTKIWYSVENCGDGSAYPKFMESKKLAELDQEYMDEGWGESCVGYITIEHMSAIIVKDIITIQDEINEIEEDYDVSSKYFPTEKYNALKELKEVKDGKEEE